ncbi:MAG: hypothetical protein ACXITV_11410, partial [Luteibaculaceae bacterium]
MNNTYSIKLPLKACYLKTLVLGLILILTYPTVGQITIGAGTTGQLRPFNYWWGFGRSAMIYTSAEIGNTSNEITINKIAFFSNLEAGFSTGPTVIRLKLIGEVTTQTSTTWNNKILESTQIYSGIPSWVNGWNEFEFSNFTIPAGQNLEVLIETNFGGNGTGGSLGNLYRFSSTIGVNSNQMWSADTNPPSGNGVVNTSRANIQLFQDIPNCSGIPIAGIASASPEITCTNSTITVTPVENVNGINFEWQQSINNGLSWTIAPNNNNTPNYVTGNLTTTTQFRRVSICSFSGQQAISTPVTVAVPFNFAELPYFQDFENWISLCDNSEAPGVNWRNSPPTGNRSWRRQDQQATANWSSPNLGAISLTPENGLGAARFHTWSVATGQDGILDLYANFSSPNSKRLSFQYLNTTGTDRLEVQISTDAGQTFSSPVFSQTLSSTWQTYTVDFDQISPTTIVRFRAISDFGFTDIGLDNVSLSIIPNIVNVTFQVEIPFFVELNNDNVFLTTFNEEDLTLLPMTEVGDIYTLTIPLEEGNIFTYKFSNGNLPTGIEIVPEACGIDISTGDLRRNLIVPSQDTIIPLVCFSSCELCPPSFFNLLSPEDGFSFNLASDTEITITWEALFNNT